MLPDQGASATTRPSPRTLSTEAPIPFSLRVEEIASMLNFELADHPVYEGGELQWFDDAAHGTGMLVFLARRGTRQVDYYAQRGLRLDRGSYQLAGGTGTWTEIDFDVARLVVAEDGVEAEVRFTDLDGRTVEIDVTDRDGRPRRPGGFLAPVGAGIEQPASLLLAWMPRFDLVRVTRQAPRIRIDGGPVSTGRLPGRWLHRRHLIKYGSPVVAVQLNPSSAGRPTTAAEPVPLFDDRGNLLQLTAERGGHLAELRLDPPFPEVGSLADGTKETGRWRIDVDAAHLTGGAWAATRHSSRVEVCLDVDERWEPARLPWLMRVVTTVIPVFRRWPTTYRWRGEMHLAAQPTLTGRWERIGGDGGRSYRRATGS